MIREIESIRIFKYDAASENEMPCFARLRFAFDSSHSNITYIRKLGVMNREQG